MTRIDEPSGAETISSPGREVAASLGPSPAPLAGPPTHPTLDAPTPRRYGAVAFGVLFALAGVLFVVTVFPLVSEVVLGCLLAAFTFRLRDHVERWLPGRRIAPAVITSLLVLVVLVPIGLLGFMVVGRLAHAAERLPTQLASADLDTLWRTYVPSVPGIERLGGPRSLTGAIGTAAGAVASSIPKILRGAFDVAIGFYGDTNDDSAATLYYCDHTASPGCDPTTGASAGMTAGAGVYNGDYAVTVNSGLVSGHTYNLRVVVSDPDGVSGSPINSAVTLP